MSYSFAMLLQYIIKGYIYTGLLPCGLLDENKYLDFTTIICTLSLAVVLSFLQDINFIVATVIIVLSDFIIVNAIYKKGYIISLIISVLSYAIIFISTEISEIIFVKVFNVDLIYIQYYPEEIFKMVIFVFAISLLLSVAAKPQSFFCAIKDYSFENKNRNILSAYIILSIVFLALIGYTIENHELFSLYYMIGIVLLFTYIIISLVYLIQIKELIRSKNDYETIYNYIANVEKIAGQLKKQEHEHNNQLIAVKAFAQDGKTDDIVVFVDNILKNKIKNKISANVGLDKLQDSILKNLLLHKINAATGFGLKVEAFIRKEIAPIKISPKEIANIIGIIMDNAIEGAMDSEGKYISVLIDEDDDSEEVNITISNTYNDVPKIYEAGASTKGDYRGNGLLILNDIEEENENVKISTEITEELFIQDIFIRK